MLSDRKPNWEKWRHVPDVRLWEGVALSLDIEPDQVDINEHGWMAGQIAFHESAMFKDRIFVAGRNLSSEGALEPTSIVMGDPSRCAVRLRQFAEWALSLGWRVPPEFSALAPKPSETGATGVSGAEKPLEGKGRASALKLILGMAIGAYGYDPKAGRGPVPKQIADDLLLSGITLTDETIREWLRVAAEEVDWHPLSE